MSLLDNISLQKMFNKLVYKRSTRVGMIADLKALKEDGVMLNRYEKQVLYL